MSQGGAAACKIFSFRDCRSSPDPVHVLGPECLRPRPAPLVVDNGSFESRVGWACAALPEPRLRFRSVAARSRGAARSETQVGNDIPNLEPLRWLVRSQFDRNVVVNFEIQELMFDYAFMHLGVNTEGRVEHPVVLTEAPCNPLHCRQMMSELLFECYGVPHVSYGVDALFSFQLNARRRAEPPRTGLVVSSGYHCSHVLPVIDGRLDAANCKRVNVGGAQAAAYLQRLLQLKYPGQQAAVTLGRMEELLHEHSYVAADYQEELEKWRIPEFYEREVHRMQLPFAARPAGGGGVGVEERRAQQLRRLQEINARRREEKIQQDQERLDTLLAVQELLEDGLVDAFHRRLVQLNMDSAEELQSYIHKLGLSLEQNRQKHLLGDGQEGRVEVLEVEQPMEDVFCSSEMDPDFKDENSESEKAAAASQSAFSAAEYHQLFVGTERLRAPEVLFQPSLVGEDHMGLVETLNFVLDRYSAEQQRALAENVFLTGGNFLYPGVQERIEREMLAIRPFQSYFQVTLASRPALDAWYGAREWALHNAPGGPGWISRQDYEEKGGEYLSEHCASNLSVLFKLGKPPQRAGEPEAAPAAQYGAVAMETTLVTDNAKTLADSMFAVSDSPNTVFSPSQ
ncbi:actin-related protein 5 [Denticeps clupeoides]|uniref:Actin-related protein 5 n=1 Tax=Denticeps clupeoides TaxID=299321 RepID=A0AAY4CNA8_9TELE|nr:actin-related protein 5 [Denticeps clupeoides]